MGRYNKSGKLYLSKKPKKNKGYQALSKYWENKRKEKSDFPELTTQVPLNSGTAFSKENTNPDFELSGRRIVDINFFLQQMKQLNDHQPFSCNFSQMKVLSETRKGLRSGIKFKCSMCHLEKIIWTEGLDATAISVNTAAVIGSIGIGIGFSNLEELVCALNIPPMSTKTYGKEHDRISVAWEKCAQAEMKRAVEIEKQLALERGDVDAEGVALLTVIVDGTWGKRSYRSNYSSLSGAAAIIGYHTKKVLHLGVRNKYCIICMSAKKNDDEAPDHKCFKNWEGSSTAMEADVIVQGFLQSVPLYGVKYVAMIGDGDSNVYKKVLDAKPYDNIDVEKIECRNHLLKNFCNKLKEIAKSSALGCISQRKLLANRILRLRNAVVKAAEYRKDKPNGQAELVKDIKNAPRHVFGDHQYCDAYFCNGRDDINHIPELEASGILYKIMAVIGNLACHARSLLHNSTNNAVESFNAVIAKHVGGKRINFSLKGSYETRCNASLLAFNTKEKYKKIHKEMTSNSPGQFCKNREQNSAKRKRTKESKSRKCIRRELFGDDAYGPNSQKPDVPKEEFEIKKAKFLKDLEKNEEQRSLLEAKTRLQSQSPIWREERKNLLTASMFGVVCHKLPTTSCKNIVKSILYQTFDTNAMAYGRQNEKNAIEALEQFANVKIDKCGLFVDEKYSFFGATPDGIVREPDENGNKIIVEVKCPLSCTNLFPNEAILSRKFTFWKTNKEKSIITEVNKKHNYYFQVQGQLHITKAKYCLFTLWTTKGIKVEKIEKDDSFWATEMEEKLKNFYVDCLLPEILDPRYTRSMTIRDPEYILKAIERKQQAKNIKN